jgi:uncharacterized protein with GYD domain
MGTYFMFGKYSAESIKDISGKRTADVLNLIKRLGGKPREIYAMLGPMDLVLITDFPGTEEAMKASLAMTRLTGIGFTTSAAIRAEDFDKITISL